jgi:cell division protease FtsH
MDAVLELVDFLKMPDQLRRLSAVLPRGVLLVGPRGSGKTLLAQALADEALVPLFRVPAPELVGATAADALRRVRALFERAEEAAPCVVILEDLEGVSRRGVRQEERGGWEHAGTLHALLAELERFDPRSGVVMLAATSRPDVLDPTLLRPGRFDRVVALERPDRYGREAILRIHAQHVRLGSDVSLADVADRTPGLVGADLAALVNEAALVAARREHAAVMREDLETALGRVVDVVYRAVRVFGPEERELLAAHEAGRAVAAALCEAHPDPARGASLVPRDPILDLPLVRRPIEERRVLDEPALKARLTELVAGRIAETILLGRLTSASREPLARARALARWMAEEIGIRAVDAAGRPGPEAPSAEVEAGRLLLEAEARARNLLLAHRDVLAEAATRLAFRERIGSAELLRLVHGHETPGPAEEDRPE